MFDKKKYKYHNETYKLKSLRVKKKEISIVSENHETSMPRVNGSY